MSAVGPGVALLARLTGRDAHDVATQPGTALRALAELARDTARLAADRSSPDEAVRQAAERRAAEVLAAFREVEAEPDAARTRFQDRLGAALEQVLRDLQRPGP